HVTAHTADYDVVMLSWTRVARCHAAPAAEPRLDAVFGQVEQFVCERLAPDEQTRLHCPPGLRPGSCRAPCWPGRRCSSASAGSIPRWGRPTSSPGSPPPASRAWWTG